MLHCQIVCYIPKYDFITGGSFTKGTALQIYIELGEEIRSIEFITCHTSVK
jgi:hypothetical protein